MFFSIILFYVDSVVSIFSRHLLFPRPAINTGPAGRPVSKSKQ